MANTRRPVAARTKTASITISAEPVQSITVSLVGKSYNITPPKTSLAIALATAAQQATADPMVVLDSVTTWVESAFSAGDDADDIKTRLNDSTDALDFPHLMELMTKVIEHTSGNPSTSSRG